MGAMRATCEVGVDLVSRGEDPVFAQRLVAEILNLRMVAKIQKERMKLSSHWNGKSLDVQCHLNCSAEGDLEISLGRLEICRWKTIWSQMFNVHKHFQ